MRKALVYALLFVMAGAMVSCLNDDSDYIYTDDTAITAFTLGSLKRVFHTTSSEGEDSTYTRTVDCSDWFFYIDQNNREIYNPDSLYYGIRNDKIICTVTSRYSATVYLMNLTGDTLNLFDSSDSIDFTTPREFYIYSNSGNAYRSYTVHVNVHQEQGDTFVWKKMGTNSKLASLEAMRGLSVDTTLYVFGTDGSRTLQYRSEDGLTWTDYTDAMNTELAAEAYDNMVTVDGYIYTCSDGTLLKTADGVEWETLCTGLTRLITASRWRLYAYDADGTFVESADDGLTWEESEIDDDAELLPTFDISSVRYDHETNTDADQLVIVGNRSDELYPDEDRPVIWGKADEQPSEGRENEAWMYFDLPTDNNHRAPRVKGLQVAAYDSGLIAIGGDGIGTCEATAFDYFYFSKDGGITWIPDEAIRFPDTFNSSEAFALFSDSNNFLWVVCGTSGQVWRGRLNRLGWDEIVTAVEE